MGDTQALHGEIGNLNAIPVIESRRMSWRDAPIYFPDVSRAIYVGDAWYFREHFDATRYVRAGFDALYRRFGLQRGVLNG